jgi:hypothetical protein
LLALGAGSLVAGIAHRAVLAAGDEKRRVLLLVPTGDSGSHEGSSKIGLVRMDEQAAVQARIQAWGDLSLDVEHLSPALPLDEQVAYIRGKAPHVIVTYGATSALRLNRELPEVPIVAWGLVDPVAQGLATSYTKPIGAITGTTQTREAVTARQVEALRRMVPGLTGIAVFGRTPHPQGDYVGDAIRGAGLAYEAHSGSGPSALETLGTLRQRGFQAVIYSSNPTPLGRRTQQLHAQAAIRSRTATIGYFRNMVEDGLLMSYGELDTNNSLASHSRLKESFAG